MNELLPGTDSNGGQPGTLTLRFTHPGTFVFYCRFHAHLDADDQPVAPGLPAVLNASSLTTV